MDKILSIPFLLFMDSAKASIPSSAGYKKLLETTIFKFFLCIVQLEKLNDPKDGIDYSLPITMATLPKEHPCSRARTCTSITFF
ncbi:MAG: hypothetical protein ACN6O7_18200 [Sphingobacterium sp.]